VKKGFNLRVGNVMGNTSKESNNRRLRFFVVVNATIRSVRIVFSLKVT